MSRYQVDPRAVDVAASTLRTASEELRAASCRVTGALLLVAGAAGSGGLAATCSAVSRRWEQGLGQYADAGLSLAVATQRAAQLYDLVELQARGRFTPVGHP